VIDLTNAEAALMGLLAEGPKHPYQIEKDVEYRDMRSWTDLSMSAIYKLLAGLEKKGLVASRSEIAAGNRTRKVFHLTEEGQTRLQVKIRILLAAPEIVKDPFHLGIYFAGVLPLREVRQALAACRKALAERTACYARLETFLSGQDCPIYHQSVAIRPQRLLKAEIRWIDELTAKLESRPRRESRT
jgi:DNA-binding PadR family transcriptional regulator